ncbi:MAG: GAF domain-containing protein, partial [Deltaproteobacteria bacterium]
GEVAPSHELVKSHIYPDDLKIFEKAHATAFYRKDPHDIEYRIIRKDGVLRTVHSIAEVEWDEEGKPLRHFGCLQDISERKKVAEELVQQMQIEMLGAEIGMALARGDTLQTLLQPCAEAMVKHLDAVFARIWTFNQAEDRLELQASAGLYTRIDGCRSRVALGDSKIGVIAQKLQPVITNSVIGDPLFIDQEWAEREGMVAFAGHPLVTGGRLMGVVAIFARKPLADTTLKALASISDQLALGIRRQWAEEALRQSEKELRFLSSELLNAQEKERARFARELHDGVGQSLSTMKVRLETLAKIAKSDLRSIQVEDLENLVPMIRQTIEEVRNTSMDLRPSTLDSLGILPTIDWFCREFQTTYPVISIQKQIDIEESEVPDFLKIIIYRILQEALNNAANHSGADLVTISLIKTDGEMMLALQDNGRGFNLEEVLSVDTAKRGFGLTSMKERAELSGGSFAIESSVGEGTTIRATWKI